MGIMNIVERVCMNIANRGNEILDDYSEKLKTVDDAQLKRIYQNKKAEHNNELTLERVERELKRRKML